MIESAARADQLETLSFPGPYYTWEVPAKPVSVAIPLAMMDRLEQETVVSFRSISSRGSEIGGVLFGTVVPGTAAPGKPALVTVSSYEAVSCGYSLGPLYRLSEADLSQLDQAIARAKTSGQVPVGFFRSHTRKGLSLDADDRRLLDLRFADPLSIALLVRPAAAKASIAGIFIWESGEMRGDSSYLEFPFRSTQCTSAAPRPAPPAGARAQIVPIASRREPVLASMPLTVAPPPPAPEPEVVAIPEPPPAPAPEIVVAAPAFAAAIPEPQKRAKRAYGYAAAAVLAIALAVLAYFGGLRRGGLAIPQTADSGLTLRIERSAADLLLTWNRESAPIRNAAHAVLDITDGTQSERIEMDLRQLKNGSIVYSPVTADVVFRMDITDAGRKQLASESVRVLGAKSSPLTAENTPAPVPAAAAPVPAEPEAEEPQQPAGPPRVTRPFNTESLSTRLRPASPTDLPDAPLAARTATAVPALPASLTAETHALAAPPPTPASAAKPSQGGNVETARLVSRVDPEYPKFARDAGAKGAVRLVATVGSDGRVKSVKAVSGHPLLVRAATEAVMQWVYRPTYLNGIAVETPTDIVLNFVSER